MLCHAEGNQDSEVTVKSRAWKHQEYRPTQSWPVVLSPALAFILVNGASPTPIFAVLSELRLLHVRFLLVR